MPDHLFSVGFNGVFGVWTARRIALQGLGGGWRVPDDIVPSSGFPSTLDLLYPDRPPLNDLTIPDAELCAEIERLTPHLIRPVRLIRGYDEPQRRGFLNRLFGGKDTDDTLDLANHQAGKPLHMRPATARLEHCQFVDVTRLTVALARDFVARDGTLERDSFGSASYGLSDIPDNHDIAWTGRAAAIVQRPYREEFAYELPAEDGPRFIALPLDQDRLLIERRLYHEDPRHDFAFLLSDYARWFGTDLPDVEPHELAYHNLFEDFSCAQFLRANVLFLNQLGDIMNKSGIGSSPATAGLFDGRMDEPYGAFANRLSATYSHLDAAYVRALIARHGPLAPEVLGECHREADLGEDFGGGLFAREAEWMIAQEFARTAEDITHRRGPFAQRGADTARLQEWMDRRGH